MPPTILTLEQWGGRNMGNAVMKLPVSWVHIHHSVTDETLGVRPTDDAIADLLRLDVEGKYGGIAYSAAGHPEGVVGVGQGLQIGAHTLYWNGYSFDHAPSFGYCFIGDFQPRPEQPAPDFLTPEAIDGFRYWRDTMLYIGALAPDYKLRPHRDAPDNSTACPGDDIIGVLDTLYLPYSAPAPGVGDTDMENPIKWRGTYVGLSSDEHGNVLQTTTGLDGIVDRKNLNVKVAKGAKPFAAFGLTLQEGTDNILAFSVGPNGGAYVLKYAGRWLDAFGAPALP